MFYMTINLQFCHSGPKTWSTTKESIPPLPKFPIKCSSSILHVSDGQSGSVCGEDLDYGQSTQIVSLILC